MIERGVRLPDGRIVRKVYFTDAEKNSSDALITGAQLAGVSTEMVVEPPLHAVLLLGSHITPFELIKSGRQFIADGKRVVRTVVDTPPL